MVVERLVDLEEVEELKAHVMAMLKGRIDVPGQEPPPPEATEEELVQRFTRVHQLHRWDATCERFLLHPRVLDVLEALIGPDVLALQTMQFFNAPGMGGQGWHQDSYYITTYPDTLIGALVGLGAGRRRERLPVGRTRLKPRAYLSRRRPGTSGPRRGSL